MRSRSPRTIFAPRIPGPGPKSRCNAGSLLRRPVVRPSPQPEVLFAADHLLVRPIAQFLKLPAPGFPLACCNCRTGRRVGARESCASTVRSSPAPRCCRSLASSGQTINSSVGESDWFSSNSHPHLGRRTPASGSRSASAPPPPRGPRVDPTCAAAHTTDDPQKNGRRQVVCCGPWIQVLANTVIGLLDANITRELPGRL